MTHTLEKPSKISVAPFGIEIDHPRNADMIIQGIPGCRLRGAIRASKPSINARSGLARIPLGQAESLGKYPEIPGMQIHVNPSSCTYVIVDPLNEDEDLLARIKAQMDDDSVFATKDKLHGVPEQQGTLDVHRMKSLCRELYHILKNDHGKIVKGTAPSLDDVENLPGRFLLNPGSTTYNQQPKFEDDLDEWAEKLTTAKD